MTKKAMTLVVTAALTGQVVSAEPQEGDTVHIQDRDARSFILAPQTRARCPHRAEIVLKREFR